MIQIIPFPEGHTTDTHFFESCYTNLKDMYDNVEGIVGKLESNVNVFYTPYDCIDGKNINDKELYKRRLKKSSYLVIDIDDIDLSKTPEYVSSTLSALEVSANDVVVISSGNGLHFILDIDLDLQTPDDLDSIQPIYTALLGLIANAFYDAGLPFSDKSLDRSAMNKRKILRLPNTINVKPEKGTKECKFIYRNLNKINKTIFDLAKMPDIRDNEVISGNSMKRVRVDADAVMEGCEFLKFCKESPDDVTEPQWFNMLLVLRHVDDTGFHAHEYSRLYSKYNEREVDRKLKAMESKDYGPALCTTINNSWGGCINCEHYTKSEIHTPILIQGANHFPERDTGFWVMVTDKETGKIKPSTKLNYDRLLEYFRFMHPYKVSDSRIVYEFSGTHWDMLHDSFIKEFVEENVKNPSPSDKHVKEFLSKVHRNNVVSSSTVQGTELGKVNFSNCVLDIVTGEQLPHNKKYNFRYVLPYEYSPDSECPKYDEFIKDVLSNDSGVIEVLHQFIGCALAGYPVEKLQKCLILAGTDGGSNGKGVLTKLIQGLVGDNNCGSANMRNIERDVYHFDGTIFNICAETDRDVFTKGAEMFKQVVAGDTMTCKRMHKDTYPITPTAKLILCCNNLPTISALESNGIMRRLLIIPMLKEYRHGDGKFNPNIVNEILDEAPAICNKMIAAYKRFRNLNTILLTNSMYDFMGGYIRRNNPIAEWYDDNVIRDQYSTTTINDLYDNYKMYNGMFDKSTIPKLSFSKLFVKITKDSNFKVIRRRVNGSKITTYKGLRLATKDDDDKESV